MKGVPKMECSFSGFQGFAKHLEPPYTRWTQLLILFPKLFYFLFCSNQGGDIYFESVNCSANIAMMMFHAAWFREKFGKLGMVHCLASKHCENKFLESCHAHGQLVKLLFFYEGEGNHLVNQNTPCNI